MKALFVSYKSNTFLKEEILDSDKNILKNGKYEAGGSGG